MPVHDRGEPYPVEAVAFDYGGVLTAGPFAALEDYARELKIPDTAFNRFLRGDSRMHQLELGALSARDYFKYVCIEAQSKYGVRVDIRRLAAAAGSVMGSNAVLPEMLDLVAQIRATGRQTALVTNNVPDVRWRDSFPFELFDQILDSSELGIRKPDPRIFRLLIERCKCAPDRIVFIDDFEENIEAADAQNLRVILFTDPESCRARLEQLGCHRSRARVGTPRSPS